jgi:serine/threonine protein phosphatase PrpC
MIKLKRCIAKTAQGPHLQINEDGYDFDLDKNLFMILDGFGGSGIGDVCVENVKEHMRNFFGRVSLDPDSTLPFYYSPRFNLEANALINALMYTNKTIYKENTTKEVKQRAGVAGQFVCFSDEMINITSIGNTLAYLYRNNDLRPLCIPDDFNNLSRDDKFRHFKTAPLNGLGLFRDLKFDNKEIKLCEGDQIILLTDGVYGRVAPGEILSVMDQEESLKDKINTLFNLSNDRGNLDNQTVMILNF